MKNRSKKHRQDAINSPLILPPLKPLPLPLPPPPTNTMVQPLRKPKIGCFDRYLFLGPRVCNHSSWALPYCCEGKLQDVYLVSSRVIWAHRPDHIREWVLSTPVKDSRTSTSPRRLTFCDEVAAFTTESYAGIDSSLRG